MSLTSCFLFVWCTACDIPHVASYRLECEVSSCIRGFNLNSNRTACIASVGEAETTTSKSFHTSEALYLHDSIGFICGRYCACVCCRANIFATIPLMLSEPGSKPLHPKNRHTVTAAFFPHRQAISLLIVQVDGQFLFYSLGQCVVSRNLI